MKDTEQIRELVDRFMDGTTTLDEELQLYDYFSHEDAVPDDLRPLRQMFADYAAITSGGQSLSAALPDTHMPATPPARAISLSRWRWKTAAAVVVLIAGGSLAYQKYQEHLAEQTYEGSYVIVNGERIDDIKRIRPQIEAVLLAAQNMEESMCNDSICS